MKRSDALASLSRDHHHALVVSQKLRRADAATAREAADTFLTFWNDQGQRHFRLEEDVLFPGYATHGDAYHPLMLAALGDHVEIRSRAQQLAAAAAPEVAALQELGERLGEHVRLEERQLFPLIEETMPANELAALAAALERAEREG